MVAFAFLLLLLSIGVGSSLTERESQDSRRPAETRIVLFEDSVRDPAALATRHARRYGVHLTHVYRHAIKGYAGLASPSVAEEIASAPEVRYVQVDDPLVLAGPLPPLMAREGAAYNAKLDIDGIDDYRVDADIAVIDEGMAANVPNLNLVSRVDCMHPDPATEGYVAPAAQDPKWHGDVRLNGSGQALPYGCLEDAGEPATSTSHGAGVALGAARIDVAGTTGIARGARVWSVRGLRDLSFGEYPNPDYDPEDPESPQWLPELSTSHVIAAFDWISSHGSQIDVVEAAIGCARIDLPPELDWYEGPRCDDTILNQAIDTAVDQGIVVVVAGGNISVNAEAAIVRNHPDVVAVSAVSDFDRAPGGLAEPVICTPMGQPEAVQQKDDWRRVQTGFGLLIDMAAAGPCSGTSSASSAVAGAAAVLASNCDPDSRADVEFIVDTLMAEGDTGSVAEGGWEDTAGDGWQEPLLNVANEEAFDPRLINTQTGEKEALVGACEWRSHQADSDVNADGRADLVFLHDGEEEARVLAGTAEGYAGDTPVSSQQGRLDPALLDGRGHYAIDVADVTGDRNADLVTAKGGYGLYVHPGTDAGTFGAGVLSKEGTTLSFDGAGGANEPIAVADVNDDGRSDLVSLFGTQLLTFPGNANGTFGNAISSGISIDSALLDKAGHYPLDVIDVTGEELDDPKAEPIDYNAKHANADLVTMHSDGKVRVYPGKVDGKFGTAILAAEIDPVMDDGKGEEPVGLGDINRDRRADLLTLSGTTLKLYKAKADGTFATATQPYAGAVDSSLLDGTGEELIGLLDYSRDGLADLVSVKANGTLMVYAARRDSTFAAPVAQSGSLPTLRTGPGRYEPIAEKPFLRRVGCKATGCTWTPPAHVPRFEALSYPLSLAGDGFDAFTTSHGPFTCKQNSLSGQLSHPSTSLSLSAGHGECSVLLNGDSFPTSVAMNSCRYVVRALNVGPPYSGKLDVACDKAGEAIEYKVLFGTSVICTVKIGPQQGLGPVALSSAGAGAAQSIVLNASASGIKYQTSGSHCAAETRTDGAITGKATLAGKNQLGQQAAAYVAGKSLALGFFLAGKASVEVAQQPRFEAESYPLAPEGTGNAIFTTSAGAITCKDVAPETAVSSQTKVLALDLGHSECASLLEGFPTLVETNSCNYALEVLNVGPPYQGKLGVACSKAGDAIEFQTYLGNDWKTLLCTTELPPQAGGAGVDLFNLGAGTERAVEFKAEVNGLSYETFGSKCNEETRSDGILSGSAVLGGAS